jgi:hypothetical protein
MRRFSSLPCSLNTIAKRYSSDMAQNYVKRVTLFKVPKSEHIDQVLQAYEVLKKEAKRVYRRFILHASNKSTESLQNGEPYIVSNAARKVLNTSSPLSEGYTIMSQSIFKNHSDHDFYDRECTAHKKLKACTSQHRTSL